VARRRAARRAGDAVAESVVGGRHPGGREQSVRPIPCVGVHAVVREVPSCVIGIAGIGDLVPWIIREIRRRRTARADRDGLAGAVACHVEGVLVTADGSRALGRVSLTDAGAVVVAIGSAGDQVAIHFTLHFSSLPPTKSWEWQQIKIHSVKNYKIDSKS